MKSESRSGRLWVFVLLFAWVGVLRAEVVVSSFSTVLSEIAREVGGSGVRVVEHVKPGQDPHDFEPRPGDLKQVSKAAVVLLSAKHMEGYVGKLREVVGAGTEVVEVGDRFPSLKRVGEAEHVHKPGEKHVHGSEEDPHWWHSVDNMRRATRVVEGVFVKADPTGAVGYRQRAEGYVARLDALHKWVKGRVAELPRGKRTLVTSHDAFQYFAKEYGFKVLTVVGLSSADQPSSKAVAELIATVKKTGVKAVFAEETANPKVMREVTRETGAVLGQRLYADGLGTGDLATYEGMVRHNVSAMVDALK
jgi:zinc/manganese transport system substrate-binding protein